MAAAPEAAARLSQSVSQNISFKENRLPPRIQAAPSRSPSAFKSSPGVPGEKASQHMRLPIPAAARKSSAAAGRTGNTARTQLQTLPAAAAARNPGTRIGILPKQEARYRARRSRKKTQRKNKSR
jgi:hypothetical protein